MVYLLVDDQTEAALALEDMIRESGEKALSEPQKMGLKVVMLTGDAKALSKKAADLLHLDDYVAKIPRDEKSEQIKKIRRENQRAAMEAAGYNSVDVPLTAGIIYPLCQCLPPPAAGGVVISLTTVIVAVNAKLLFT